MDKDKKNAGADGGIFRKRAGLYFVAAAAFCVLFSAAYVCVLEFFYDRSVHLYQSGTVWPSVYNWAFAAAVVLLLTACLTLKKSAKGVQPLESPAPLSANSVFFCGATGFMLDAFILWRLYECISGKYTFADKYELWGVIALPFAAVGSAYFILTSVKREPFKRSYSLFADAAIAALALMLVDTYFDMHTPLNCPPRLLRQLAIVGAMLYLLLEIRFLLGTARPSQYVGVGAAAAVLLFASSASSIVLSFQGYRPTGFGSDSLFDFTLFCFAAYIVTRLYSYIFGEKIKPAAESGEWEGQIPGARTPSDGKPDSDAKTGSDEESVPDAQAPEAQPRSGDVSDPDSAVSSEGEVPQDPGKEGKVNEK